MKTAGLIVLLLLFAFAPQAMAHTQLMESDPEEGEVVTEELEEIRLTFGENVEEGSTFELLSAEIDSLLSEDAIAIEDHEVVGTLPSPLADGEYEIDWYTISADGHPIEGVIEFTVDMGEAEEDNQNEMNNENEQAELNNNGPSANEENGTEENLNNQNNENNQALENEADENVSEEETEEDNTSLVVPLVAGGLIAFMIPVFIWLRKRDK